MILTKAAKAAIPKSEPVIDNNAEQPRVEFISSFGEQTTSRERVSPERAMTLATFYRAANTIIDDYAMMPFHQFERVDGMIRQVEPDSKIINIPYLMEISPNQWGWTPMQFKQAKMQWKLYHGNSYVWRPPVYPPQLLILPADRTAPVLDKKGGLWYAVRFNNSTKPQYIPAVEVLHEMINPDATGFVGRGVITYARETMGRQLGAHKTKSKFYSQGMNPSGVLYLNNIELKSDEERDIVRESFAGSISGSDKAYNIAIADKRVREFKPISLSPKDAEFLGSMERDDREIANFLKFPLHMLNMGKEAYESNEQKHIEYLQQCLDAHLVPTEQGARIRWLTLDQQGNNYFKFNRSSLLRMTAKERAETNEIKIRSGQINPNEARAKDDLNAYQGGEDYYMTANNVKLGGKPDAQSDDK